MFFITAGSGGCIPGILAYVRSVLSDLAECSTLTLFNELTVGEQRNFALQATRVLWFALTSQRLITHAERGLLDAAVTIAFGGIGGIFATTIFRQKDFPRYIPGLWATIGCQFFMLLLLAGTTVHFRTQNKRLLAREVDELEGTPGFSYTI
jgi:hypothetical protein